MPASTHAKAPLLRAAELGELGCLRALLAQPGLDVGCATVDYKLVLGQNIPQYEAGGRSALLLAVEALRPDAVALLDTAALPANEAELLTFLSRDRCAHAPATSCAHGPWQFRGVLPKSLDGLLSQQQDDEVYIKNDSELLKRQGSRPLTVSDWAKQVERVRGRRAA